MFWAVTPVPFLNPVDFETGFRETRSKVRFSIKFGEAVPETEVMEQFYLIQKELI
jgi:hypothetical protein